VKRTLWWLVLVALAGAAYQASLPGPLLPPRAVHVPAGIQLAPNEPKQSALKIAAVSDYRGARMTALADYEFSARVISLAWYRMGAESEYSPVDLGIGWGEMSDTKHIDALQWRHSARFLFYRFSGEPPIPQKDIARQFANVHVLPANPQVLRTLETLRPGQRVNARGTLVELAREDGWRWRSSLVRDDEGNGACEVMYLESIAIQ
jgi:hypothetical protein